MHYHVCDSCGYSERCECATPSVPGPLYCQACRYLRAAANLRRAATAEVEQRFWRTMRERLERHFGGNAA